MRPSSKMQTFYDNSAPEAVLYKVHSNHDVVPPRDSVNERRPGKAIIALGVTVAILVIAALGIGLGLGLRRRGNHSSSSFPAQSSHPRYVAVSRLLGASDHLLNAIPTSSRSMASQTPLPEKHELLDNTSIAALSLPNGDRSVFFEERTGTVRRALYSHNAGSWVAATSAQFVATLDARNNTPLSAIDYSAYDPVSCLQQHYSSYCN